MNGNIIILLGAAVLVIILAVVHIHECRKSWPGYDVDDMIRHVNELREQIEKR